MAFECWQESSILRVRVEPPYTAVEIEENLRQLVASRGYQPGSDVLVEVRGSQNTPAGQIRRYATLLPQLAAEIGNRIAICTDTDLAYGLSRMFAVFAAPAGYEVTVFRDTTAARAWLLEADDSSQRTPPAASNGA